MPAGERGDDQTATRRELVWTIATLSALVIARSLVFTLFEQAHFDSDQAIVGLMAKHLSEGRAFPVETRYLSRDGQDRIEATVASAVQRALAEESGSLLVFLPGEGEIRQVEARLATVRSRSALRFRQRRWLRSGRKRCTGMRTGTQAWQLRQCGR